MEIILIALGIIYSVVILAIWVISIGVNELEVSEESKDPQIGVREFEIIDVSGEGIISNSKQSKTIDKKVMSRSEITRITKALELNEEDYVVNQGSDLLDILESINPENLQSLYLKSQHEKLQYLAKLRIKLHPREISIRRMLIKSLYISKKYDECQKYCRELLLIEEENIDGHRYLARCLRLLGNEEESMNHYSVLNDLLYYDRETRVAAVRYNMGKEKFEEALEICDEILENSPEDRHALIYKARTLDKLNRYDSSLATWEILLESGNDDLEAHLGLGRTYYSIGMDIESQYHLEQCLEINPGDSRAKRTLTQVYSRSGSLSEALEMTIAHCIGNPEEFHNWERRLVLEFRIGNENIEEIFEDIIALNGGSVIGYSMAASLAADFLFLDKSIEIIDRGTSEYWDNPVFYLEMSRSFGIIDDLTLQYKFLKNGIDICKDNEAILENLDSLHGFMNIVGISAERLEHKIISGETFTRTGAVIDRIIQLSARQINESWKENKSVAMISSSLGRGGAERQVVSCLKGISSDSQWNDVKLFCYRLDTSGGRFSTYKDEVEELGIEIDEFGNKASKDVQSYDFDRWKKLISLLPDRIKKTVIPLYHRFMEFRPSIVHSWQDGMNISSSIAAIIAGVPRIVLFARSQRPDKKTVLHIRRRGYLRDAYQTILQEKKVTLAHNSFSGSDSYKEWLESDEWDFPVIYNGVDFKTLENESNIENVDTIIEEYGLDAAEKIIGSVFRIVEEKNPRLWIEVASKVVSKNPNVHFVLVGGGMQLDLMREYVEELNISDRVHLIGQSKDVGSWLEKMDLFFLTSKVEGLPNVLIEAQGFGVPVISTNAGGCKETFVDGVTGELILEEDAEEITNIIIDWLGRNEKWLDRASEKSRINAVKKFGISRMYDDLIKIYDLE